jgi:hypothetical protein
MIEPVTGPKPKFEKLFGKGYVLHRIDEGDLIPVGGDIASDRVDKKATADLANLEEVFVAARKELDATDLEKVNEWLEIQHIEIDPRLFVLAFGLRKILQKFPQNQDRYNIRLGLYKEGNLPNISEIVKTGTAECAEIAATTQAFLQREGFNSELVSGEVLWERDQEFGEPHSFIVIKGDNRTFIYDPYNPTPTSNGDYPSFYTSEKDFSKEIRKGKKRFVTTTNILNPKLQAYFGVGNLTNISEEDFA